MPFGINSNAGAFVPNNFPTFFKLDKKHSKFNKTNPRPVEKSRRVFLHSSQMHLMTISQEILIQEILFEY